MMYKIEGDYVNSSKYEIVEEVCVFDNGNYIMGCAFKIMDMPLLWTCYKTGYSEWQIRSLNPTINDDMYNSWKKLQCMRLHSY